MIRFDFFMMTLICWFSSYMTALSADTLPQLPAYHHVREHKFDIKNIDINLRFNWQLRQAYGETSILLSLTEASDSVMLDAAKLSIQNITLTNGKQLKFRYDGSEADNALRVLLDKQYPAGEELTLKINYHTNWINRSDPNSLWGSFGKGIRFLEPTSTDPIKRKQIWSMGDATGNRYWFPCYDAPDDVRSSSFTATVDKGFTAISNGRLLKTTDNADGTRTFSWKADVPYANHLTSFVVGEYVDVLQKYNDTELHNFGYEEEAAAVKASVERLPDMVKYFSEVSGVQYPYASYAQVFVQDFAAWSGNHTMSVITENMVDDFRTHADYFYLWDLTEAEALAQQWFGNYTACKDWSEIWLNKSFAHYFNCLYNEHKNGRDEFLLYQLLYDQQTVYLNDWNGGYRHPVVTKNYDDIQSFTGDNYANTRGALVLHMLRKHLGDDVWWKAIKFYMQNSAGKLCTTADFQKSVEQASGENLDWFFDQWIYKMGHPVFEVSKQYDKVKHQLKLFIKQTQITDKNNAYPQTVFYRGKMDIEIDDSIYQVWIAPQADNIFTFASAQMPLLVQVDAGSTWIKEMTFDKSLDEYLYQLQHDNDITGRNMALTALSNLAADKSVAAADKARIFAAFRNVIQSSVYWRLRTNVLAQYRNLMLPAGITRPAILDTATSEMLLSVIRHEKSWLRTSAITFLGNTGNPKYLDVYLNALNDESERVINAAANALGKTKSPKVFKALETLKDKPSWKNQSLISALNGFRELGNVKAYKIAFNALCDLHSPHWTLATPVWDYRLAAAETIASLGKSAAAFPFIFSAFNKALAEDDVHGIFYNIVIINMLADSRGQKAYELLKEKYKNDTDSMATVNQYEEQFKNTLKKQ